MFFFGAVGRSIDINKLQESAPNLSLVLSRAWGVAGVGLTAWPLTSTQGSLQKIPHTTQNRVCGSSEFEVFPEKRQAITGRI